MLALAAYGAAACGAAYVKVGMRAGDPGEAVALLRAVQRGARHANPACILVAVGYADTGRIGALPWAMLPEIARAARIGGCIIDTAIKDGRGLFDYCDEPALAGVARRLRPDIAGFRGAACAGDRVSGRVDAGRVAALRMGLSFNGFSGLGNR